MDVTVVLHAEKRPGAVNEMVAARNEARPGNNRPREKNSVYIKKPLSKGKGFAYPLDLYIDTVLVQTHYREGM
ncbi:hypothetical protein [Pseudomonas saponiphila]|nr:hypothetical protein [Pseudomonas saponiphila]